MVLRTDQPVTCPEVIGRAREIAFLERVLSDGKQGVGKVVLLSGEAGIGKTRLIATAKEAASQAGYVVLESSCFEPDRTVPYAPLIDLIRELLLHPPSAAVAQALDSAAPALVHVVPELSVRVPGVVRSAPLEPDQERHALFGAVLEFPRDLTWAQPVLEVVRDQLHELLARQVVSVRHGLKLRRNLRGERNLLLGNHQHLKPTQVEEVGHIRRDRLGFGRGKRGLHGLDTVEPVFGDAITRGRAAVRSGQDVIQHEPSQAGQPLQQWPMRLMPVASKVVDAEVWSTMQEEDNFHHGTMGLLSAFLPTASARCTASRAVNCSATQSFDNVDCAVIPNSLGNPPMRYTPSPTAAAVPARTDALTVGRHR